MGANGFLVTCHMWCLAYGGDPQCLSAQASSTVGSMAQFRRRLHGVQYGVRVPRGPFSSWARRKLYGARTPAGIERAIRCIQRALSRARSAQLSAQGMMERALCSGWPRARRIRGLQGACGGRAAPQWARPLCQEQFAVDRVVPFRGEKSCGGWRPSGRRVGFRSQQQLATTCISQGRALSARAIPLVSGQTRQTGFCNGVLRGWCRGGAA